MFNDRFNDSVRRRRLASLLVLAGLGVFGLGVGHLATRALGAPAPTSVPACAVFWDRGTDFTNPASDRLRSDGSGPYVDYGAVNTIPCGNGNPCVANYVTNGEGLWRVVTPNNTGCPLPGGVAYRSYKLVLGTAGGCPVAPDPTIGGGGGGAALDICGSNTVYGQVQAGARGGTSLYFRTDPNTAAFGQSIEFALYYRNRLTVTLVSATQRIVTTDGVSPLADLYRNYVNAKGQFGNTFVGTFSVPCRISVTKLQ